MENLDYVARIRSARVYDVARVTSLDRARRLSDRLGAEIYLKREDTQDVALSAKVLGMKATIVMPETTPRIKIDAIAI